VQSQSADDRAAAAEVLGDAAPGELAGLLLQLMQDDDTAVRRAALDAAGRSRLDAAWPLAVQALADRRTAGAAAAALAAGGEEALAAIENAFVPSMPAGTLIPIARVVGRIRGHRATSILRERIAYPQGTVRTEVLEALRSCGYRAEGNGTRNIEARIDAEARDGAWKLFALRDLGSDQALGLLTAALDREVDQSRRRLFLLLSFIYDSTAILRARDNLAHPSKDKRAYASEVLDVTLPREVKPLLLPLLEEMPLADRCRRLAEETGEHQRSPRDRVGEVLGRTEEWITSWTRSCAARAAAAMGLGSGPWGGTHDMLTIERILTLKSVDMFARTSEGVLAQIADVLEEVDVPKDHVIFQKGDLGDSLYIVVQGRVRVYDGSTVIGTLGERDIFGELALLDPEPRFASIAAETDVRLFRLDREAFSELMAGNIEIVRGVLHVLCQRLRQGARENVTPAARPS
jgi:HEAT repeat protein